MKAFAAKTEGLGNQLLQPRIEGGVKHLRVHRAEPRLAHVPLAPNAAIQVGLGLLGAFVVEPKRPVEAHRADVDYVMVLNDGYHGYTLNGKGFPATEPSVCSMGQVVRVRRPLPRLGAGDDLV